MGKHTPGPWQIKSYDGELRILDSTPIGSSPPIADVNMFLNGEANARLIAAAPEMLEVIKGLVARIEEGTLVRDLSKDHLETWPLRMLELVKNLQAAQRIIARAEGGE